MYVSYYFGARNISSNEKNRVCGFRFTSIQGTSFGFVGILIVTGKLGGIPLILGTCMLGCLVQFVVAFFLVR
jgi:xanthine/uracil permease